MLKILREIANFSGRTTQQIAHYYGNAQRIKCFEV